MNVSEMKALIKDLADDAEVIFTMSSGCCGDNEDLRVWDFGVSADSPVISFNALPGYRSCIQVSQTITADKAYWAQFGKTPEDFI